MPVHRLIYVSRATDSIDPKDLVAMVSRAWHRNAKLGLTGVLCFAEGCFLQVLEGEPGPVNEVFLRIANDERHHDVRLISYRPAPSRMRATWSMGFIQLPQAETRRAVPPGERPYGRFPVEHAEVMLFLGSVGQNAMTFGEQAA